jgi:hypothetical protein
MVAAVEAKIDFNGSDIVRKTSANVYPFLNHFTR